LGNQRVAGMEGPNVGQGFQGTESTLPAAGKGLADDRGESVRRRDCASGSPSCWIPLRGLLA
jgi:hypothetical protein